MGFAKEKPICLEQPAGSRDEAMRGDPYYPVPIAAKTGGETFGRGEWSKKVFGSVGDQLKHL